MEVTVLILQILLKYGPEIAAKAKSLLAKTTVTDADWDDLFLLVNKSGESYFVKV